MAGVKVVPMTINVVVPEKFALDVAVGKGDVHVKGKVEGNVRLATDSGNIRVGKLRQAVLHTHHRLWMGPKQQYEQA
jgi:hypothetical protein